MCKCINVEIQSYDNQTVLEYPEWFESSKEIRSAGIDNCLLEEIKSLWKSGIQTVESCCGHNKAEGYISVLERDAGHMLRLGYELYQSNFRNESGWNEHGFRIDTFKPKSISTLKINQWKNDFYKEQERADKLHADVQFWKKSFEERTADYKREVDKLSYFTVANSEEQINKWARKMKLDFTKPSDFALGWRKCYEWIIGVYP